MDKKVEFKKYRETYQEFWYRSYSVHEDEKAIYLEYEFEIPNLTKFHPKLQIDKKNSPLKSLNTAQVKKYGISYRNG